MHSNTVTPSELAREGGRTAQGFIVALMLATVFMYLELLLEVKCALIPP
jgi:hypothetical protein